MYVCIDTWPWILRSGQGWEVFKPLPQTEEVEAVRYVYCPAWNVCRYFSISRSSFLEMNFEDGIFKSQYMIFFYIKHRNKIRHCCILKTLLGIFQIQYCPSLMMNIVISYNIVIRYSNENKSWETSLLSAKPFERKWGPITKPSNK